MDAIIFAIAAVLALGGALGVVLLRNPAHCALSLVATLISVAVFFAQLDAALLVAMQIIVYAGAIVVLFLFVIMLLGVDRTDDIRDEPLRGQRSAAAVIGVIAVAELVLLTRWHFVLGAPKASSQAGGTNVEKVGEAVFTRYLFPFEVTSVLLVIAVVGAVLLSRKPRPMGDADTDGRGVRA